MTQALTVGLLAANADQLSQLQSQVHDTGHQVVASITHNHLSPLPLPTADIWLMHMQPQCEHSLQLLHQLEDAAVPVIYACPETLAPNASPSSQQSLHQAKVNRLAQKLAQFVPLHHRAGRRAQRVWVLGASTGGPEAVAAFLARIPQPLEGTAFIYAQHINPSGLPALHSLVRQRSQWPVQDLRYSQPIEEKTLYILHPHHSIDILTPGLIAPSPTPWNGNYAPSIDQVIAKVARVYGPRAGAIIFSGMGEDGTSGCQLLRHLGGQVWAQSPVTAILDSMPQSVIRQGCAQLIASPQALAQRLQQFTQAHPLPATAPHRSPP